MGVKQLKTIAINNDIIIRINNEINKLSLPKRKPCVYSNNVFIEAILTRLKTGLPYAEIAKIYHISSSNLYRKFNLWCSKEVFKKAFNFTINTNKCFIDYDEAYIDSSIVINKYGYKETTGINTYDAKKHRSNKISCIVSKNGIPLNIITSNSITHDIKLVYKTLPKRAYFRVLLGDKGYISNAVKTKLKLNRKINFITESRRNQKIQNKVNTKARITIEHFNSIIKQNRIINVRYDKCITHYNNMLYLACLKRTLEIMYKSIYED